MSAGTPRAYSTNSDTVLSTNIGTVYRYLQKGTNVGTAQTHVCVPHRLASNRLAHDHASQHAWKEGSKKGFSGHTYGPDGQPLQRKRSGRLPYEGCKGKPLLPGGPGTCDTDVTKKLREWVRERSQQSIQSTQTPRGRDDFPTVYINT